VDANRDSGWILWLLIENIDVRCFFADLYLNGTQNCLQPVALDDLFWISLVRYPPFWFKMYWRIFKINLFVLIMRMY